MARVRAAESRLSPSTSVNAGCLRAFCRNSGWPLEKLSHPITFLPLSNNASAKLLPMKPAAPVTKNVCMLRVSRVFRVSRVYWTGCFGPGGQQEPYSDPAHTPIGCQSAISDYTKIAEPGFGGIRKL